MFDAVGSAMDLRSPGGHRIDAICSQLITSRQHTSHQPPPGPASPYDNVVVKQEVDDSDSNTGENSRHSDTYVDHHHQYHHQHTTARYHSPRADVDFAAAADKDKMLMSSHSALAALTDW